MRRGLTNSWTGLPPEIVSLVLWHLRPRELGRCLLVNSAINALVRPLLSGYVVTEAENVTYPFMGEHPPRLVPRNVHCLTVLPHLDCYESDRIPFMSTSGLPLISSCRVLKVMLDFPDDEDHIASPHPYYFPPPQEEDSDDNSVDEECISVHPLECRILHFALQDAQVAKLVLRHVPLVYGNVNPELMSSSAFCTVSEGVLVFKVGAMSQSVDGVFEDWHMNHDEDIPLCLACPEVLNFPVIGGLDCALPPNVERLTFVFWTSRPGEEVAPPCCRVREPWDWSGAEDNRMEGSSEPEAGHKSCWEEGCWRYLAEAVVPLLLHKLIRVTIVNASSIVPTRAPPQASLELISEGIARHDIFETKLRAQLYDCLRAAHNVLHDRAEELVSRVSFMYMKEWLQQTDWEDVFSWSEVRPWLNFKAPAPIADCFKPAISDGVKRKRDMDEAERFHLKHRAAKPGKNS